MFVQVNGARLYFDVDGAGLVPDGAVCARSRRWCCCTAAGFDHALSKPAFSALADIAQVIYDAAPRATRAVPQLRPFLDDPQRASP